MTTKLNSSTELRHPVAHLIRNRRSVRAYDPRPIEPEKIHSLFEATRWAPSSSNEQPWTYIYAERGEPLWQDLFDGLNEGNQLWAKDAPLLVLSLTRKNFLRTGMPNRFALYDLGAANSILALEAVDLGLQVRQMGGYQAPKLIDTLRIPADFDLGAIIAIGYPGNPDQLPENLRNRELAARERKEQSEFVMNKSF